MSDSGKAVFLSYASQDAEAAKRICDALRAAGVEVWFDQSELRGGDAWDQKIRRQIKACALFMPVISANTQARPEGYFRLEWKLAVDRSHLMADDQPFLVPVAIDDTPQATARVPDKFCDVQWTRLVMTETPTAFAQRIQALLRDAEQDGGRRTDDSGRRAEDGGRRERDGSSVWWTRVVPLAGILLGLGYAFRPMWISSRPRGMKAPATAPGVAAPRSEARQLVAKARALSVEKYDSTADDYAAAEGMIKRALELDSNDGEIWAFSSQLNTGFRTRGFDQAPARNATARRHAERALKLAPDSVDALFALGYWQRDNDPDLAVAEETFKKVLAAAPDHPPALLSLASIYTRTGRVGEGLALLERVAKNPQHAALAHYLEFLTYFSRARFAEADRAVRQSIAVQPSANSQGGLAMVLLTWKGEADEAARTLASGPASIRNEHRTIWITAQVQLARRAPEEALKALDRLADDFIQDSWFVGPKAYFVGRAHALAGRPEAARVAWEQGLAVVRVRLKENPSDRFLHLAQGELLAWLGQAEEARREARVVEELQRGRPAPWYVSPVRIYAALGRADEALPMVESALAAAGKSGVGWPLTAALLRLDPLWDKLRGAPEFQALLKEPGPGQGQRPDASGQKSEPDRGGRK